MRTSTLLSTPPAVRLATIDDAPGFAALFNSLYRRHIDEAYVRWQFFDDAFPGRLAVAEHGGRIVGAHAVQPRTACLGQRRIPLLLALDSMVAPDWRGLGLYGQLVDYLAEHTGAVAMYCLANDTAERVLTRLMGWRRVATLSTLEWRHRDLPATGLQVIGRDALDASIDAIGEGFPSLQPRRLVIERTAAYLRWRFDRNPWHRYQRLVVSRGLDRLGYVVCKQFVDPSSGAMSHDLVDVVWTESSAERVDEILSSALQYLYTQKADAATIWARGGPLETAAFELGFVPSGVPRHLCLKLLNSIDPADGELGCLLEGERWHLTMADAEFT